MILQKCFLLCRTAKSVTRLAFARNYQVTVVGGVGGVGQPLSMMLKTNPLVSKLVIHDIQKQTPGVALDLSYIPSSSCVEGHVGEGGLEKALKGANIVIVTAGKPHKKGVCDADLLKQNAPVVAEVMKKVATICPCALIAIVTDPVNSMVPLAAEVLRKNGGFDKRKLFGVTTINLITAQALFARAGGIPEVCAFVPVIGGNSYCTILPLFSQATPCCEKVKPDNHKELISKVRNAATEVANAKGDGSITVSMSNATNMFVQGLLQALAGTPNIQYAYVQNNDFGTCYFAGPVLLDCQGVYETQMVPMLSKLECELLEVAIDQLRKEVLHGQVFFSELSGNKGCDKPC